MSKKLKLLVKKSLASILVVSIIASINTFSFPEKASALENNLGRVPIMGWSSWNNYRININEDIIKNQADAMVANGLDKLGYQYINIDDGYLRGRDEEGNLLENRDKFPSGMKAMADYIHGKGLKAGLYSDAGNNTCGSIWDNDPYGYGIGLYGHDKQDTELFFNKWGYDFIKVDWCGGQQQKLDLKTRYTEIRDAILATGKPVMYNICSWSFPGEWALEVGNSWRISGDIDNNFNSILSIIDRNEGLAKYAGPGHFNDMDMLQVGRGMSYDEDKSHFSMWSMMASPLLLGNDMTKMSKETLEIIKNKEIIDINQDVAGLQATKVKKTGSQEVWLKPLGSKNGSEKAIALFNRGSQAADITVNLSDIGLTSIENVRDVWAHKDLQPFNDSYTASVPAHGIVVLRVSGEPGSISTNIEIEAESSSNTIGSPARIVNNNAFSGAKAVGWLGKGGTLQINNINSDVKGKAKLKIYFMAGEARNLMLSVNGGNAITLSGLKSQDWSSVASTTLDIELNEGNNNIKFFHSTEYMPDIDKIEIEIYRKNYDVIDKAILDGQSKLDAAVVGNKKGQYPQSAVDALNTAINSAKATRENISSTQIQINEAVKLLNKAIEDFLASVITIEDVNKGELEELYNANKDKIEDEYTVESWTKFKTTLDEVKAVIDNSEANQEEVDAAITKLNVAIEGLEEKPVIPEVNKAELIEAIEKGKAINLEDYTLESVQSLVDLLENAETLLNDKDATQESVDKLKEDILNAINNLVPKENTENVDKTVLTIVIEYAEDAKLKGALENVVPAVVKEFEAALEEAKTVLSDKNATESQVDVAVKRLINVIHMLEFKKGDKAELIKLVDIINALNKNKYTPSTWATLQVELEKANKVIADENAMEEEVVKAYENLNKAFEGLKLAADKSKLQSLVTELEAKDTSKYTAGSVNKFNIELANAKSILGNEESTQEQINEAYNNLIRAYLELRLIPDKSKLEELINKVKEIDLSKYTEASAKNVKIALAKAEEVIKDEEANDSVVANVLSNLEKAVDNLVVKDDKPSGEQPNTDKPNDEQTNTEQPNTDKPNNEQVNTDKPNNEKSENNKELPKTGDVTSLAQIIILAVLLSVGGMVILKRKNIEL